MSYSTRASRYANAALVAEVSPERGDFDGYAEPGGGGGARGGRAADGTLSPLAGMWLQEHWERAAHAAAGGAARNADHRAAPAQRVRDFVAAMGEAPRPPPASAAAAALPDALFMGALAPADLTTCLPRDVARSIARALAHFTAPPPPAERPARAKRRRRRAARADGGDGRGRAIMAPLAEDDALLIGVETRTSAPVHIERDARTLESVSTAGLYPIGEGAGHAGGIMTSSVDGVRCAEALMDKYDPAAAAAAAEEEEPWVDDRPKLGPTPEWL